MMMMQIFSFMLAITSLLLAICSFGCYITQLKAKFKLKHKVFSVFLIAFFISNAIYLLNVYYA